MPFLDLPEEYVARDDGTYRLAVLCPHCRGVLREEPPKPAWKPPLREEVLAYRARGEEHPALRGTYFKPQYEIPDPEPPLVR